VANLTDLVRAHKAVQALKEKKKKKKKKKKVTTSYSKSGAASHSLIFTFRAQIDVNFTDCCGCQFLTVYAVFVWWLFVVVGVVVVVV